MTGSSRGQNSTAGSASDGSELSVKAGGQMGTSVECGVAGEQTLPEKLTWSGLLALVSW